MLCSGAGRKNCRVCIEMGDDTPSFLFFPTLKKGEPKKILSPPSSASSPPLSRPNGVSRRGPPLRGKKLGNRASEKGTFGGFQVLLPPPHSHKLGQQEKGKTFFSFFPGYFSLLFKK